MGKIFRFQINVHLEGVDVGELWVEIPWELYEKVRDDAPKIDESPSKRMEKNKYFGIDEGVYRTFQQTMEEDYPQIAEAINAAITNAMYSGAIVDLEAVENTCGEPISYMTHSGCVTVDYKDADDYVKRVERRYRLIGEWDEL